MTEEWLDHVELDDGQFADLLKRFPYERAQMIEAARERDMALTQSILEAGGSKSKAQRMTVMGFTDIVLRASLWNARLKHDLTGEEIDASQVGMARDKTVKTLAQRAMENYIAWFDEAHAGPKEFSETDSPTPPSENPSETSE